MTITEKAWLSAHPLTEGQVMAQRLLELRILSKVDIIKPGEQRELKVLEELERAKMYLELACKNMDEILRDEILVFLNKRLPRTGRLGEREGERE